MFKTREKERKKEETLFEIFWFSKLTNPQRLQTQVQIYLLEDHQRSACS